MWLQARMYMLLGLMFAIVYALIVVVGWAAGFGNFFVYGIIAAAMLFIQYMIGPKMVEFSMRVKYVSEKEQPELHKMVAELAQKAGIKKPRVGISEVNIPNAFAFGKSRGDGRICVTKGIMGLMDKDELKAVLGHEISHIANRDVTIITILSIIPMICWYLGQSTLYSSGNRDRGSAAMLIGIFAIILYFVTNLLVLYASRIREYYADRGAVNLGNKPNDLASALYKLVYGSAKAGKGEIKQIEGYKAFFVNDPSRAIRDFSELKALDKDMSGTIDQHELGAIRDRKVKVSAGDRIMEVLSTHPNMLKRIQQLSKLQAE
jgi:heat shock protein HtpX